MQPASPRRVLVIASAAVFMASLDLFIVNIAFPDVQRDLGGTDGQLSWILNAYAIVLAALLVPLGRLADAFGRRAAFVAGLVVFAAASAVAAIAPSVELLVAARVLQALGAALLVPTSLALLLSAAPPAKRTAYVGAWAAAGGVAAAAGPPIGGLLVQLSWRWVFIVNVPIAAVAIVAALRSLQEERDESATGRLPDLAGAALLTLGVGALTAGIVQGPEWGWGSERVLGLFAGSLMVLAAFGVRTANHPVPVIEPELLRVRSFAAANLAGLAFFAGFGAMLLSGVLFLTRVWGEDVLTAGLMISPGPVMAAVFSVVGSRLIERLGHRAVAVLGGLAFGASSLWWMANIGAEPAYATAFLPPFLLGGIGVGLVIGTLSGAAVAGLPPQRFATGSAVFGMSRQLGSALGVAILVAVIGTPAPDEAVAAFRDGVWIPALGGLLTAVGAAAMGPVRVASAAWTGSPRSAPQVASSSTTPAVS